MGKYCFARCRMSASSVVVCNARYCKAGQYITSHCGDTLFHISSQTFVVKPKTVFMLTEATLIIFVVLLFYHIT